jgi:hypothetical protein
MSPFSRRTASSASSRRAVGPASESASRVVDSSRAAAVDGASAELGRKVAPTIYSWKELRKRVRRDNAFVTRVLAQPKLWLIGDESALTA